MAAPQMRIRPRFVLGLIAVFVILPVVIILFIPAFNGPDSEGQARVKVEITTIATSLMVFRTTFGHYPTNDDTATILACLSGTNPSGIVFLNYKRTPTQMNHDFLDPWGTPYKITPKNQTNLAIKSAGRNKSFGDKDDWIYELTKDDFSQLPEE